MTEKPTILAATFMRESEHQQPNVFGDLIKIDLSCGHERWGNATMHYKVGVRLTCRSCEAEGQRDLGCDGTSAHAPGTCEACDAAFAELEETT